MGSSKSRELPTLIHTSAPSTGNSKKGKDPNQYTQKYKAKKKATQVMKEHKNQDTISTLIN